MLVVILRHLELFCNLFRCALFPDPWRDSNFVIAVVTVKTTTSTDSRSCWHEATTEEGLGFQLPVVQPNPEGMSCSNPHACFNRFKLCEAFYSSMDLPRRASANPSWRGNAEEGHVHTSAGKLLQHLSRPRQTHLFLEAPSIALRHQVHQAFKTCFPFTWRAYISCNQK